MRPTSQTARRTLALSALAARCTCRCFSATRSCYRFVCTGARGAGRRTQDSGAQCVSPLYLPLLQCHSLLLLIRLHRSRRCRQLHCCLPCSLLRLLCLRRSCPRWLLLRLCPPPCRLRLCRSILLRRLHRSSLRCRSCLQLRRLRSRLRPLRRLRPRVGLHRSRCLHRHATALHRGRRGRGSLEKLRGLRSHLLDGCRPVHRLHLEDRHSGATRLGHRRRTNRASRRSPRRRSERQCPPRHRVRRVLT
jgi:hypothetical protein